MVSVASNVLGTIGTVFWCVQMIPQIVANYRKKNCEGLPPLMLFLWSACGVPFSIYFVSINSNIPVQVQPQCFTILCLLTWAQSLYYPPVSMPIRRVIMFVCLFLAIAIAMEVGFIVPLRRLYMHHGVHWPPLIFGILASILLAVGLIPPYFEAYKRKGRIVGINFGFLAIDLGGALFSLASLAVATDVDIMGSVLYSICASLEIGIVISHLVWYIRFGRHERMDIQDLDPEATRVAEIEELEKEEKGEKPKASV